MLKLKDIFPSTKIICNSPDYYTKINILFENRYRLREVFCWGTSIKEGSLVEIRLDQETGLIFEITLVGPTIILHEGMPHIFDNVTKKIGLPLFATDLWKPKPNPLGYHVEFYDPIYYVCEEDDFEVYAVEKNITIVFSTNTVVLNVINEPVIFGFDDDNNLCYIHVVNVILGDEGLEILP